MICEKILGNVEDDEFSGFHVDYVDIDWFDAFSRIHRKISNEGEEIGIRLGEDVLKTGLNQGDVLFAGEDKVIAVNIPPARAIRAEVSEHHPEQIAKLCYEVGNTHTSMFRGENNRTFYIPFNQPLFEKVSSIHGVKASEDTVRFDFSQALSSSINNHHH